MKRTVTSQSGFTEETERDRPILPEESRRPHLPFSVIILTLPVLIAALGISLGILGLIMQVFGA
ncbi:hypothetical protein [Paraburkholderia bannensis]|uniref:hypothetical protein n=1 Tax=Paraburkholderia bannensis TaxID=765414 RepID=UPI000486CEE8|nr:hypothetical protein [Paraburkholderia bannensis]